MEKLLHHVECNTKPYETRGKLYSLESHMAFFIFHILINIDILDKKEEFGKMTINSKIIPILYGIRKLYMDLVIFQSYYISIPSYTNSTISQKMYALICSRILTPLICSPFNMFI